MAKRVLLVEDEPELRRAIVVRLNAAGFQCEVATNGKEGLEKVEHWHPDLVIADLLMPEMGGCEMVQRLRARHETSRVPVIVLTALPRQAKEERIEDLPSVRLMHKPFDSAELLVVINDMLAKDSAGGPSDG
ncbi:MAG: response regulator [Candidatus Omnitrophica bacterium]|nr:response regulator [Candidatus Omnitrophota bacterium]